LPKLVTVWREQDIQTQARQYIRSYILFPSGLLGLVCMVGGIGSLGYQFIASSTYTWMTFVASSSLLLLGGLCGWAQTRYHRYLLATVPEVFAARIRSAVTRNQKKKKRESGIPDIEHPGRKLVPLFYLIGVALLLTASAWAIFYGALDGVPAVLMPWAGFYWGKLFFWRGVVN
jgi:hypothetical protein